MSVEIESLGPIHRGWVPKVKTTKAQYAALKEAHGTLRSKKKGCECVECRGVKLK